MAKSAERVLLSVKEAAEYTGKTKQQIVKALESSHNVAIFGEGTNAVVIEEFHGETFTLIDKAALDAWVDASNRSPVGNRSRGAKTRRFIVYAFDHEFDAINAALATVRTDLVAAPAFVSKKAKTETAPAPESTPMDEIFDAELIEA